MHARELIELAALVAAHGPVLIRGGERISSGGIEQYWTSSKVRLDRWAWSLKDFTRKKSVGARHRELQWSRVRGVLEEILVGEVLTRVWTTVLCAYDRRRGADEVEPVARSVMIGHMEARHRALTLMVQGPGIEAEAAVKLNRLRHRVERWNDLLIGYLAEMGDVGEFAVDPKRVKEFAQDLHDRGNGRQAWLLLLASLRASFQQGLDEVSPNADLNARIAAGILACFPSELFDSTGLFRSLWLMRLTSIADDTQGMIDELLTPTAAQESKPSFTLPSGRGRCLGR